MRLAALIAIVLLSMGAQAQPAKVARIIVPAAAGGPTDVMARVIAPALAQALGQPVVVEDRGGAGGIVGTEALARSAPDGATLGLVFISHATNPALHAKLPYDTLTDFASIALVGYQPLLLVVHPSLAVASVKELVALARTRPGALNYGADTASAPHLAAELFKHVTATQLVHVPYKGNGPALNDTISGQLQVMFNTINTSLPHVKAGRLKALATTASRRSPLAPDVPTMAESGFAGVEVSAWYGLVAPAAVPKETLGRLNGALNSALSLSEVRERFAAQGVELAGGSPAELDAFIRAELAKWRTIIRAAGITAG
jgi:tripartite-type tricarboxylate transporter receptor subunit TctC